MNKEFVEKFKEKPADKETWAGLVLGLTSLLIFPLLGISAAVIRPVVDEAFGEIGGSIVTISIVVLCLVLIVTSWAVNIRSFRRGERSWVMWVGLAPSLLVGLLLMVMIGAEIIEGIRSMLTGEPMRY